MNNRKKTDEKQDRVIEQLKQNQKALTSGIQDIMTLNQELPQLTPEDFVEPKELPAPEVTIADINQKFNEKEMEIIKEKDHRAPVELLNLNVDQLEEYAKEVKDKSKKIGYDIGVLKRKNFHDLIPAKEQEKETIDAYGETVNDVKNFKKHYIPSKEKKGTGVKQPKRNAYKIHDGFYGGLVIDVPRLFNEIKLNVFRGGKLLYSADADRSLINLLTKRFNPKTKYSINAVKITLCQICQNTDPLESHGWLGQV